MKFSKVYSIIDTNDTGLIKYEPIHITVQYIHSRFERQRNRIVGEMKPPKLTSPAVDETIQMKPLKSVMSNSHCDAEDIVTCD